MAEMTQADVAKRITGITNDKGELVIVMDDCDFSDVTFIGDIDFSGVTFEREANFGKATFEGEAIFIDATFDDNCYFDGANAKKIFLEMAEAKKLLTFNRKSRYPNKKNEGDPKIENIDLSKGRFETINVGDVDIKAVKNEETARILKYWAKENLDNKQRIHFKQLEMDKIWESAKNRLSAKRLSANWYNLNDWGLIIMLSLNSLSNKHGKSWLQGVGFILVVGGGLFLGFLLANENIEFDKSGNLNEFIKFMYPLDFKLGETLQDMSGWASLIYMFGKIIVAYGYYQIIQAFRSYRD